MSKKITVIQYKHLKPHLKARLGLVIVHDKDAKVSFNDFDTKYTGPKSRFGKYLRDLHSQGVDISEFVQVSNDEKPNDSVVELAQRLHKVLGNKIVRSTGIGLTTKYTEKFDWSRPGAKDTKYYRMAQHLLKENEERDIQRVIDIITRYA